MLAKCANPSYNAKFKYLREGRLFEFNVGDGARYNTIPSQISARREWFWLCEQCSRVLTLQCTAEGDIVRAPRIAGEQQAAGGRQAGFRSGLAQINQAPFPKPAACARKPSTVPCSPGERSRSCAGTPPFGRSDRSCGRHSKPPDQGAKPCWDRMGFAPARSRCPR